MIRYWCTLWIDHRKSHNHLSPYKVITIDYAPCMVHYIPLTLFFVTGSLYVFFNPLHLICPQLSPKPRNQQCGCARCLVLSSIPAFPYSFIVWGWKPTNERHLPDSFASWSALGFFKEEVLVGTLGWGRKEGTVAVGRAEWPWYFHSAGASVPGEHRCGLTGARPSAGLWVLPFRFLSPQCSPMLFLALLYLPAPC